jgi:histidinol-phosphate aminotransferase
LYPVLARLGHQAITGSQANFICFAAKAGSPQLMARLQTDFNIGVRAFQFLGQNWVRVSIGTKEEMDSLAAALNAIG